MGRFYITTPIYYATDVPHLGHAYTTVVADALARYHRLRGTQTRFLTGTDEHGQKMERIAAERGVDLKQYCDKIADAYRATWKALEIGNDDFIRTTDPDHEQVVQELWRTLERNGDIYLGEYEGWYCVACEQFYTEKELSTGNVCPVHQKPVEKIREESFYFRLSKYREPLLAYYDAHPKFIQPAERRNEIRAFVEGELRDLSVSRTTFKWGVPVPDHPRHVIYVWMDALINYYSATRREKKTDWWADEVRIVHLIGKEISRFHAVHWPAMLMAAGLRLPSTVFCHGWWTVDGDKMSKTAGNVVDPVKLADDLGVDAFRYFVLREVPLGADGDFSHQALITRYNAELANDLGNLLNRTLGMVAKYLPDGRVVATSEELRADAEAAARAVAEAMDEMAPSTALQAIWSLVRRGNAYIDHAAPWNATDARKPEILWNVLEALRFAGHLLEPFIPERAAALRRQLGDTEKATWPDAWRSGRAFQVQKGEPLFPRIDEERKAVLLTKWSPHKTPSPMGVAGQPHSAATQQQSAATQQQSAATQQQLTATQQRSTAVQQNSPTARHDDGLISYEDFQRLDLRVGRVATAEPIPGAKKLLKLTVDLGGEMRQVVAGIAESYRPEELIGRQVILLANLKPATIRGVRSEGMILAAGDERILALSALDRDAPPGTKVR